MHNTKKILVVEDNDDCRELLARFVKGLGYKVFEAATGIEAIDRASAVNPDLIMMDLRMPGMDGGETTARLKMSPSTKDIPVLINTAYTTCVDTRRALDAGAAGSAQILIGRNETTSLPPTQTHVRWPGALTTIGP